MNLGLGVGFLLVLSVTPAAAAVPDFLLDRDYRNCLGDDEDPARAAYCSCMRQGMKSWDISDYAKTAMQAAAATADPDAAPPPRLEELAKQCMGQSAR